MKVLEWFLFSTILQGLLLLLLLYSNIVLLVYHRPTSERIFDMMLIHAPIRFFLVLQIALMFPLSLFITLGLTYPMTHDPDHPLDFNAYQWPGFGVLFGTNMLGLIVVIFRRDIVCEEEGGVALPPDDEHPLYDGNNQNRPQVQNGQNEQQQRAPREVDAEAVWG
ncbi:hypothetical protein V5O48_002590 [Marasmius crinis-equi]|uniref:Uncharacterized protein n=1 Tax=Marasmius crinis-equi TaxID=585013 RepID=A0ABR3FV86_9AGAR